MPNLWAPVLGVFSRLTISTGQGVMIYCVGEAILDIQNKNSHQNLWLLRHKELTWFVCDTSCCHICRFAVSGEHQLESGSTWRSGQVTFKLNVHDRQGVVHRSWTAVVDAVGSWNDREIDCKNGANKLAQSVFMNRYSPTGTAAWVLYKVTRSYLQFSSLSRSRSLQRSDISLPNSLKDAYYDHIDMYRESSSYTWLTWHVNRIETV